jgi:single-strand DNA-binding protein
MSSPAFVIGNLTRTPQLSRTGDGTPVVNLTLAENSRRQVEGEWVDGPTTYWDVVCFGAQAENIIASLTKGARAIAVGTFRTRTWTTSDGQERSTLEVLAEEIGPSLRWATTQVTRSTAR